MAGHVGTVPRRLGSVRDVGLPAMGRVPILLPCAPHYLIHPERFVERGNEVLVLGVTTGSHLDLPDAEERQLGVIWRPVDDGRLSLWQVLDDSPEVRERLGLAREAARPAGG